jgi:hypothetical protein
VLYPGDRFYPIPMGGVRGTGNPRSGGKMDTIKTVYDHIQRAKARGKMIRKVILYGVKKVRRGA